VHFNNLSTKIPVTSVLLIIVKKACLFTVSILLLAAVPVASKVIHSEGFKWIQSPLKITLCQRATESGKFSSSKDAIVSALPEQLKKVAESIQKAVELGDVMNIKTIAEELKSEFDNMAPFCNELVQFVAVPIHAGDTKYFYLFLTLTPIGDMLTLDFAKALVENEKLGQNDKGAPDYLQISAI
jgi:hypothetical protein